MYEDHYGFTGRPFQLTPDPRFWFDTATHRRAMSYLGYGLSQGEGFIVITGDIGAGKTTLVGHLLARIDREQMHAISIVSTQVDPEDLLRIVAANLDVPVAGLTKADLLAAIERGLHAVARSGRRTLLIVDEAQALPLPALEELRMLSNFSAGGHPLMQIFLLGQPEFRERLEGSGRLEQLRQRVIALHHLGPMEADEVEPYMAHRLAMVGWNGSPRFTGEAFEALYHGSGGIPRVLNQLAGRVLLHGAIEQLDTIDADVVAAVIEDAAMDRTPEVAEPVSSPASAPAPEVHAATPATPAPIDPEVIAWMETVEDRLERQAAAIAEPAVPDADLTARIAALEARIEDQDATLRRILTLLIDWVESGQRPPAGPISLRA